MIPTEPRKTIQRFYRTTQTFSGERTYRLVGEDKIVNKKYILNVENGSYTADTLISLLWQIFQHRFNHWRKGEGWND